MAFQEPHSLAKGRGRRGTRTKTHMHIHSHGLPRGRCAVRAAREDAQVLRGVEALVAGPKAQGLLSRTRQTHLIAIN